MVRPQFASWLMLTVPIGAGALVMAQVGASVGRWGVHWAAALLGAAIAAGVLALPVVRPRVALALACAGVVVVVSTLGASGLDGVTRWHSIGSFRLHPSALLGPAIVVYASRSIADRAGAAADGLLAALQIAHIVQPDAAQATAVGAAAIVLSWRGSGVGVVRSVAHAGCVAVAWSRPDPLLPAPFVEDIVARAHSTHAGLACVVVGALAVSVLAPLALRTADARVRIARCALSAYFAGAAVAAGLGEFPFPLIGFAPSAVLGAYLGVAVLMRAPRCATVG